LKGEDREDKQKIKIIRGMVALSMKELFGSFLGVFYFIYATRELGVEGMAVVSVLSMLYTLFPLFFLVAIPTALQKFIAENLGRKNSDSVNLLINTSFMILVITSSLSLICTLAIAPLVANTFFMGKHLTAFQLVSLAIAMYGANSILGSVFLGFQLYEKYGAITFTGKVVGRLISLIFIMHQYGPLAFVVSWIIENFLIIIMLNRSKPKTTVPFLQRYPIKPLLGYCFPLFCSTFVSYLGSGVFIRLLILNRLPNSELGIYETALRAVGIPRVYQSTFLTTFFPHLSKVYGENGFEEVGHNINWAIRLLSLIFSPIVVGLAIISRPLFSTLFGGEFEGAVPVFTILLFFSLINFILSPFTQGMQALGYTKKMFQIQLVSTAIAVVSSFTLSDLGVIGVAIGAETLGLASSIFNCHFFKKSVKIHVDWRRSFYFILASFAMILPVYCSLLLLPRYQYLPLSIIVGMVVYLAAIRVFRLVEKRDLDVILCLFPKRFQKFTLKLFGY